MASSEIIAQRIAALDLHRQELLESLQQVEDELAGQRALLARLANRQLPVCSLPDHLLTDILLLLQHRELTQKKVAATHKPGIEFIASQICHEWREAVLSTPLLWRTTRMQIKHPRQESSLAHFNSRLARSHPCPIDIFLDLQISDDFQESQLYHALAFHSNRWRKLSLITETTIHRQVDINPILSVANAIHLELFSFSMRSTAGLASPPPQRTTDFGSNILTTVRLAGQIPRLFHLPLTHVTTLHLVACPITILHDAPRTLQHLSLTDMLSIAQLSTRIALPNLLSLRIISNFTANVINWLVMPRLRSLTLDQLPHFDWTLEHHLPTVKYLTFNQCSTSASVISSLLLSLPNIETLTINGGNMERLLAKLAATDTSDVAMYYKRLSKLSLFDIEKRRVGVVGTVVFVRCFSPEHRDGHGDNSVSRGDDVNNSDDEDGDEDEAEDENTDSDDNNHDNDNPKRLTHLTLDNRTKTGIRATPGKWDWLQERLTVESVQYPEAWPVLTRGGTGGGGGEGRGGRGYAYLHPAERAFWDAAWFAV